MMFPMFSPVHYHHDIVQKYNVPNPGYVLMHGSMMVMDMKYVKKYTIGVVLVFILKINSKNDSIKYLYFAGSAQFQTTY